MAFRNVAVLAASLCLIQTIVSAGAEDARAAENPLGVYIKAIPSSIKLEEITSATLSRSGLLALGTVRGRVLIVDRNLQPWPGGWERSGGANAISTVVFSQDESAMAGVTANAIIVWPLDGRPIIKIPVAVSKDATIALSPNGRWLAVADFGLSLFDVSRQQLVREFEQEDTGDGIGKYEAVAFTPDGAIVAAASVDNIDAWNIESGKRIQHWSCKCDAAGVAFSRDAAFAVVGTSDAHALLWELSSGNVVKDKTISTLKGDRVYGTAASLNAALVAAGTAGGSVVVWQTRSGSIVARATPSREPISRLTLSEDGQVLLVEGQKAEYVRGGYDRWLMTLARR